jgi:nucleoside-diphosphate-sugar epimerase
VQSDSQDPVRILITGSTGFIGFHLARLLLPTDLSCTALMA